MVLPVASSLTLVVISAMVLIPIVSTVAATHVVTIAATLAIIELTITAALSAEVAVTAITAITMVVATGVVAAIERLVFGGVAVVVIEAAAATIVMASATHACAPHTVVATTSLVASVIAVAVAPLRLLPVWRDDGRLVATASHVAHRHLVSVEVAIASTAAGQVWSAAPIMVATIATAAAITATSGRVCAFILWLCFFDVDSAAIDLCDGIVFNQVLRHTLVGEGDEAETARRARVDIFEDYRVLHFTELHKVVLELLACQLEVEPAYEDFAFRVGELDGILRIVAWHAVLLHHLAVRVGLLNLLPVVAHHEVVVVVVAAAAVVVVPTAAAMTALASALVVICRLNIDALLHDVMTLRAVGLNNAALDLEGLVLVAEAEQDEAATALSEPVAHDDSVLHFAVLLEVGL